MKNLIVLLVSLILLSVKCEKEEEYIPLDSYLYLTNKSNCSIKAIFCDGFYIKMPLYPDTLLPRMPYDEWPILKLDGNKQGSFYFSKDNVYYSVMEILTRLPSDTVSFYVFNSDTLDAVPWERIVSERKYQRFDINIYKIPEYNYTIEYYGDSINIR